MSLKTFEHVLILADDLKKTKEFYVDLLGLKDGYRPDFPFPGHWLYLNEDGGEYGEEESLVDTNALVDEFGLKVDATGLARPTKKDIDSISGPRYE